MNIPVLQIEPVGSHMVYSALSFRISDQLSRKCMTITWEDSLAEAKCIDWAQLGKRSIVKAGYSLVLCVGSFREGNIVSELRFDSWKQKQIFRGRP